MRIEPTTTARLAGALSFRAVVDRIEVHPDRIEVITKERSRSIPIASIQAIRHEKGWIWDGLVIQIQAGEEHIRCDWFRSEDVATLTWFIGHYSALRRIESAIVALEAMLTSSSYIRARRFAQRKEEAGCLKEPIPPRFHDLPISADVRRLITEGEQSLSDYDSRRDRRNEEFVGLQAALYAPWFEHCVGKALNSGQIRAILHEEDNCLAVAGAGTGKTTTIAAKVAFLVQHRKVPPEHILLMAFTRKAKDEMASRLAGIDGCKSVAVHTFHSFGLSVLAQARRAKPALSKLADDPTVLHRLIVSWIGGLLRAEAFALRAVDFFLFHAIPAPRYSEFTDSGDWIRYLRGHELRSIAGDKVKSYEEWLIANWLFLNGIDYEYEKPYERPTDSVEFRQYKPDFYLTSYGIYIEHFGVDRQGRAASNVDSEKYVKSMDWKRSIHAQHETCLIETFSFERSEGVLLSSLELKLRNAGVEMRRRSIDEVCQAIERWSLMPTIAKLLERFLTLFKASMTTLDVLRQKAVVSANPERSVAFLLLFERVLEEYRRILEQSREVDFNDMIVDAAESVVRAEYRSPYTHVIVDEFQDISRARGRLLYELVRQPEECELFAVGDDWQSIYRFAGADISMMTGFQENFGSARLVPLGETYRFNNKMLAASSKFILKNPEQISKVLSATRRSEKASILVVGASGGDERHAVEGLLQEIACEVPGEAEVLILARYTFRLPALRDLRVPKNIRVRICTVHAAKGLEADYAIVMSVVAGRHGFPTEIEDDPLLDLVLARPSGIPHAEERRLFYVAMTRARHRTYLMTDDSCRSKFIQELASPEYQGLVQIRIGPAMARCPDCGSPVVRNKGAFGEFWGCGNFPYCMSKFRDCPKCKQAPTIRFELEFRCADERCSGRAPVCPLCGIGVLVKRTGRNGGFFIGCSEWRRDGVSCSYIE
jgi:DNA helicase-4